MITINSTKCTACGACLQSCPKSCIEMRNDENGFVYPFIRVDECVDCGKCSAVCPIGKDKVSERFERKAYGAITKDKDMLNRSTSGGIFGEIAKYVISAGGTVYGCAYDTDLYVKHVKIDNVSDLCLLNGSKYVQSDTADTFIQVKNDLGSGKLVFYSGTPCQISGLKCFLGKDFDNLITADIICHGVPSYSSFEKYIRWYEKNNGVKVSNYSFRSKENKKGNYAGVCESNTVKGVIKTKFNYYDGYYYYYFLSSEINRNSCYSCDYANINREGDFTLGDLWGAESFNIPFSVDNGCSLVLINTEKANKIFTLLELESFEISFEKVVNYNEQLRKPSSCSDKRAAILERFKNWSADEIQKVYLKENRIAILKSRIKYSIPKPIKKQLQKIRHNRSSK